MRKLLCFALTMMVGLCSVGLLAGCGGKKESDGKTNVRIAYFPNITHNQALVMKNQGTLEEKWKDKCNVSWTSFNAGPAEMEAIFAGEIDLGYIGPVPALSANVKSNGEVKIISNSTNAGAVLLKRKDSGINTVSDLAGKKVAGVMVSGFTKFKERFQGFENQYVIIGGTACDLIMENEELPFRATKDVDIVLIVESITAEFGRQFWEYVKEAGYEHLNKSTGNAQFYRFTSPKSKEYPYMIEIFSRNPDFIILEDDAVLTPLPIDDEISSLSAILLNEAYYELLKTGQMMVDGIPVLSPTCLIPFKAKAWLDLKERKLNGEQVDSKNIKKHKNDVFRLAQLITANTRQVLSSEIAEDMKKFLSEIADETVDLKSLGIRGTDKQKMTDMLYQCYGLKDNT